MKKIYLPDENGQRTEHIVNRNSVIIIGANGAGKSRLGAWIEQQEPNNVHRISAQRALTFKDNFSLSSYDETYKKLFYGDSRNGQKNKFVYKWGSQPTIKMLQDYDDVMTAIFSKQAKEHSIYINECKIKEKQGVPHDPTPVTDIDKLTTIWSDIFPHRGIVLEDAQIKAKLGESTYKGIEMSDGERVVLYLLAQCLCAPESSTIIIDEPEVHLHRSIMNKLWNKIEVLRADCLFIYITHDIQFTSSHRHATKIWVQEFNGSVYWRWHFVKDAELPEECLLEILGNRKNVLFVEGTDDSYDVALYRVAYPDYYIVPRGGCTEVINSVKAMNSNPQLHHLKAYGLIDRDYRPQSEISGLEKSNVFTLNIAEVENLFCAEEILGVMENHLGFNGQGKVSEIKEFIINKFENEIGEQIARAVASEIKYQLQIYNIPNSNIEEISHSLNQILQIINIEEIKKRIEKKFINAKESKNYSEILKVFNKKYLTKSIGTFFGHKNNDYCELIIRLLNTNLADKIIAGLRKYLPNGIPC